MQNSYTFSFKLILIPILILTVFALAECMFRYFYFGIDAVIRPWNYSPSGIMHTEIVIEPKDPALLFDFRSNYNSNFKGARFKTNDQGFRGHKYTNEKKVGVVRIAIMGNSISMGAGVEHEETYGHKLFTMLNSSAPGKYDVLNFSMPAHKLSQKLKIYELSVKKSSPDIILLPLDKKHLSSRARPHRFKSFKPKWKDIRGMYLSRLFIYSASRRFIKESFGEYSSNNWRTRINSTPKKNDIKKINKGKSIAENFIKNAATNGTHVTVLLLPRPGKKSSTADLHFFEEWLYNRKDVSLIDCTEMLSTKIDKRDIIYPGDNHPNAKVHGLYADCIYPKLAPILEDLKKKR